MTVSRSLRANSLFFINRCTCALVYIKNIQKDMHYNPFLGDKDIPIVVG